MTKAVPEQKREINHQPPTGPTTKPISARAGLTLIGSEGPATSWSAPVTANSW
jgi:hypothetical protein